MMRTKDGKLAILDFGLMTEVTDNQKYGMIEAIAHLLNRDYTEIGQDFINLDFIPEGTDTRPIVPALTKVFDAALVGRGAKSINFQELAADLAEITFEYVSPLIYLESNQHAFQILFTQRTIPTPPAYSFIAVQNTSLLCVGYSCNWSGTFSDVQLLL
jgi:hypothetical protein